MADRLDMTHAELASAASAPSQWHLRSPVLALIDEVRRLEAALAEANRRLAAAASRPQITTLRGARVKRARGGRTEPESPPESLRTFRSDPW